jgi:hypothetical protein
MSVDLIAMLAANAAAWGYAWRLWRQGKIGSSRKGAAVYRGREANWNRKR